MSILDIFKKKQPTWEEKVKKAAVKNNAEALYRYGYEKYYPIFPDTWDGEKTIGELGAPISYRPDYTALSYRSWQAYTESDLAQILVKATLNWVIGSGLKLQSEPNDKVINAEGFDFDKQLFVDQAENRFRLFAKTNEGSYSKMHNYNKVQRVAYLNSIIGGDVLCILRIGDNNLPNVQLIDGIHVRNPGQDFHRQAENRGNSIVHGVEIDENKTHIAYYILTRGRDFQRIEAIGENTGREVAFLLYGNDYRIDSVRGLPLLSAVLEKMKKLDRYNEAIVGAAEEQAKIPWFFQHDINSTGENPDLSKLQQMINPPTGTDSSDIVDMTKQTTAIRKTFQKEPYNLPIGTTMKKLDSAMERDQEVFTTGNFIFICAALETPYEVALMKYVNSFSSSRMASQSYQLILNIKRTLFNDAFNQKFYNLFLDTEILTGKIMGEGYFSARNRQDPILLQAYRNARFTGPGVPQADPNREVTAVINQIIANLLTREEGIERLGNESDFTATIERLAEEQRLIDENLPQEENNQTTE